MELIDKADIIAEIKERIERDNEKAASFSSGSEHDYLYRVKEKVYKSLLHFINTLETKEVDLQKEIHKFIDKEELHLRLWDVDRIAKHFYELGLKVRKGE